MKTTIVILVLFQLIFNKNTSQFSLEIEITGFRNDKGTLMIQLFDKDQNIAGQEKGIIQDKKCTVVFHGIKAGKYGFRFFHDENLSGELDTNSLGMPLEGYGFSNGARGRFGPPPFEKWLFIIDSDKKFVMKPHY